MEPGEAIIRKWNRRHDETNRCCVCASRFGWVHWYHQIHCCGAGCPTSAAGGDNEERTLQTSLDLTDDGDKVISLRTMQSGHTVIRGDQFDPDGWQIQEITELCLDNDEGCATNYMSVIAHVYQRPRCMDSDASAGDHDPAPTRSCRPRQKTTSDGNGPARSHPTIFPTSSPWFKSGKQRHGVFQNHERDIWTSSQCDPVPERLNGLAHYMVYVRCAALFDTLSREFLLLITMGRSEDIRLALRRREEQCCQSSGGTVGARQSLTERQPGNPVEEGAERLRPSNECFSERRQRCDVLGTMRDVWESVATHSLTMAARDPETKLDNRSVLASTGKRPVEIERPFCPHGHGEHDDAGHAAAEPLLGMLDVQYNLRTQPGRVRCSTCRPGGLRGCRREHGSHLTRHRASKSAGAAS